MRQILIRTRKGPPPSVGRACGALSGRRAFAGQWSPHYLRQAGRTFVATGCGEHPPPQRGDTGPRLQAGHRAEGTSDEANPYQHAAAPSPLAAGAAAAGRADPDIVRAKQLARRPATVVLAAAAGAVVLTVVAEPWGLRGGRLLIPLLACVPVVVLRRWPSAASPTTSKPSCASISEENAERSSVTPVPADPDLPVALIRHPSNTSNHKEGARHAR